MLLRVLVAASLLVFVGSAPASAQDLPTVRVATPAIDSGAQPFYAEAMGFFKKAGINVTITKLNSGAAIGAAVAGGAVDIGQSNMVSVATAHERGVPITLIAGCNIFDARLHQNALVVAFNSQIRSPRELNGKLIAVNGLKNITQIGADAWIDANGGMVSSLKYVEMPFDAMAETVASGRVDAAVMAEPELSDALGKKTVRVLGYPYEAIAKKFLLSGWIANAAWAKAHPDLVRAYATAMQMAGDWANKHQAQSAKILQQASGIAIAPASGRVVYATEIDPAALQPLIDVAAKYGALKASFPARELSTLP